jgi:hypothetical protein
MPRLYENFDIEVVHDRGGHMVRARSPVGEACAAFRVPLTPQEVRILGLTVARGRGASRSVHTRDVDEVKAYGQRLFDSLFTGAVLACYNASLARVRRYTRVGLRVRLRLGAAPELAQVPWEYLFDRRDSRFLALDDETPIVRYLDLPVRSAPLRVELPLRVLVMIASPEDAPRLDANREWKRLYDALVDLIRQRAVRLDRLDRATGAALHWRLKEGQYHVFHFIGHGGMDANDRGVLILEDAARRSAVVPAETIAGILSPEKTFRLAVLNACEGGKAAKGDSFAGTAQSLVQQAIPAVVAMPFEISDEAAMTLTHDFYRALAYGAPVDAALTEARRGLRFERRNELEWGTPMLYTRAGDGHLFDVTQARLAAPPPGRAAQEPPAPRRVVSGMRSTREQPDPGRIAVQNAVWDGVRDDAPVPVPALYRKIAGLIHASQVACAAGRWDAATAQLEQVLQLDPLHQEAARLLEEARRQAQRDALYLTAAEQESARRAAAAAGAFQRARDCRGDVDAPRIRALHDPVTAKRSRRRTVLSARHGGLALGILALIVVALVAVPTWEGGSSAGDFPRTAPGATRGPAPVVSPPPARAAPMNARTPAPSGQAILDRDAETASAGLSRYGNPLVGSLADDNFTIQDITLEPGTYAIAASCDEYCTDLDLRVMDGGVVYAQDVKHSDRPRLTVPVAAHATYQVRVDMEGCSRATCDYRLQVYVRRG